jgi:hypothetical protein
MAVPYTFGTATAAIPLSNLDSNFATPITLGNTAIQLGNTVTTLNNMTLANATVSSLSTPITPAQGGTGLATLTANNVMLGNGTNNVTFVAPGTSGNVLASNGTTWASAKISLPAGSVLQVVSTTKTDTFSTTSLSMTDVTGLSVSITPTLSTSKILVLVTLNLAGQNSSAGAAYQLVRGSTAIAIGDAAGSRPVASGSIAYIADANSLTSLSGSFFDSPATTSSTTYKIQVAQGGLSGGGSAYVNRTQNDTNGTTFNNARTASTITVMEIAA